MSDDLRELKPLLREYLVPCLGVIWYRERIWKKTRLLPITHFIDRFKSKKQMIFESNTDLLTITQGIITAVVLLLIYIIYDILNFI